MFGTHSSLDGETDDDIMNELLKTGAQGDLDDAFPTLEKENGTTADDEQSEPEGRHTRLRAKQSKEINAVTDGHPNGKTRKGTAKFVKRPNVPTPAARPRTRGLLKQELAEREEAKRGTRRSTRTMNKTQTEPHRGKTQAPNPTKKRGRPKKATTTQNTVRFERSPAPNRKRSRKDKGNEVRTAWVMVGNDGIDVNDYERF